MSEPIGNLIPGVEPSAARAPVRNRTEDGYAVYGGTFLIRKGPYRAVRAGVFEDDRTGPGAKGLLAFVFTRPDGAVVTLRDWMRANRNSQRRRGKGRDAARADFRECDEAGYCVLVKRRTFRGQFAYVRVWYDSPELHPRHEQGRLFEQRLQEILPGSTPVDHAPLFDARAPRPADPAAVADCAARDSEAPTVDGSPVHGKPATAEPHTVAPVPARPTQNYGLNGDGAAQNHGANARGRAKPKRRNPWGGPWMQHIDDAGVLADDIRLHALWLEETRRGAVRCTLEEFFGAAVRALDVANTKGGDARAIFIALLMKELFYQITADQRSIANERLNNLDGRTIDAGGSGSAQRIAGQPDHAGAGAAVHRRAPQTANAPRKRTEDRGEYPEPDAPLPTLGR